MINRILEHKGYTKKEKLLFIIFLIINWLNFGNYSFLYYSWNGLPMDNIFLVIIRNIRIAIPIVLILFLMLSRQWRLRAFYVIKSNFFIYMLCFIYLFNSIISSNIINSLIYSLWLFFSILLINLVIKSTYSLRDTLILFKYGSIITVFLLIPSIPFLFSDNEASFFSSKNYYAYPILIYLLCEFFLLSYPDKPSRNKRKILRFITIVLMLVIMFLSGRRSPLLFALIGFSFFIYKANKIIFILSFSLAIIFIPIIISFNILGFSIEDSLTYKRFNRIKDYSSIDDSSYNKREFIWDYYLLSFKDSPLIGNGFNTSDSNLSRYYSGELLGLSYHNSYLQILVEAGIIGILFYILQSIKSFVNCLKYNNLLFVVLFFSTIFINWFESNLMPGQVHFTFSIAILVMFNMNKK